jgi:hypothetical protein
MGGAGGGGHFGEADGWLEGSGDFAGDVCFGEDAEFDGAGDECVEDGLVGGVGLAGADGPWVAVVGGGWDGSEDGVVGGLDLG